MYIRLALVYAVTCCILHGCSLLLVSDEPITESLAKNVKLETPASETPHTESPTVLQPNLSSSKSADGLNLSATAPSASATAPSTTSAPTSMPSSSLTSSSGSTMFSTDLYGSTLTKTTFSDALFVKPDRYFYWDKDELSAKEYQQNYCSFRCHGDERIDVMAQNHRCRDIDCIQCECERPSCEVYGICCPDITEPYIEIEARSFLYLLNLSDGSYPNKTTGLPSEFVTTSTGENPTFETITPIVSNKSYVTASLHPGATPVQDDDGYVESSREDPKLFCDNDSNPEEDVYLYIRSCPSDFADAKVRQMCEEKTLTEQMSTDTYVRVTDRRTNATYYNQRCAECNGVTEMVPWDLNIDCWHNMRVYPATNLQELLRLALGEDSKCSTSQDVPDNVKTLWCELQYYRDIIDTCNVTGLWKDYDEDVRLACEGDQFSSVIYRAGNVYDRWDPRYKNIFCYICNQELYPIGTVECYFSDVKSQGPEPPFSLLLGFRERRDKRAYVSPFAYSTNCTDEEWATPNGDCLPLQCSPGKLLNGSTCFTALPTITGLGYRLRLWFIPHNNTSPNFLTGHFGMTVSDAVGRFMQQVEKLMAGLTEEYSLELGVKFDVSTNPTSAAGIPYLEEAHCLISNSCLFLYAWVEGLVVANRTLMRDDFENSMIQGYLNSTVLLKITNRTQVLLQPIVMTLKDERWDCEDFLRTYTSSRCVKFSLAKRNGGSRYNDILEDANLFLNVTNILSCSFVSFDNSSYTMRRTNDSDIPPGVSITLDMQVTDITFTEAADFSHLFVTVDGKLQICAELLNKKLWQIDTLRKLAFYRQLRFESQADASTFAQYILTLICMSASMFCLAVTFMTYFRFSVLRSVAGKNNMFLCVSLLVAQGFLLAASHVSGPSDLCTTLGILTHFMWLCMFCWSFICCFHMFRVFTAKTRNPHSTARSETVQLVKRVVTSVLVPALVIVTVVVASYVTSDTEEIGYGDRACYLDTSLLVGVSMVLPLAVVIVSNVTFFIITVVKIQSVRKLQSHDSPRKEDHQNLYIYIKLSTLTGSFWTIFIIAEALNLDFLRFIAIVLNGLQGVFIFISYNCNMRVLNLYRQSLGLEPLSMTSTSEQHPKTELSSQGKLASLIRGRNNNLSSSNTKSTDQEIVATRKAML